MRYAIFNKTPKAMTLIRSVVKVFMYLIVFMFTIYGFSQIQNVPVVSQCGDRVLNTIQVNYLDFQVCGSLPMYENSVLIVETTLLGYGTIRDLGNYNNGGNHPKIIFQSCVQDELNTMSIDSTITLIFPTEAECQTLTIEDIGPDDMYYLTWPCDVFDTLGRHIFKGKYQDFTPEKYQTYFIKFEHQTIKRMWYD